MADIVAIAAVARNGVIGSGNDIPWRIREDWVRFKALTMGQVLIMGRKTYDSIGRPLPGRTTLVITRDRMWRPSTGSGNVAGGSGNMAGVASLDEAFARAAEVGPQTIFVAGGGEIYRAAWDRLTRLEITEVEIEPDGDVTFPVIDGADWAEVDRVPGAGFAFVTYRRVSQNVTES